MNVNLISIGAVAFGLVALAWTDPVVKLRGNRFKPLSYDQLTPPQKKMIEHLLAGERRGSTDGPFNVFLRSPEMGDLAQELGAQVRFHSSLPRKLNEMAILITARFWTVQFEWQAHHRGAVQAGLSESVVSAIADGKRPTGMQPDEDVVYNFCHDLLTTKQVSDANFQAVVSKFGERGAADLINAMGYYKLVSLALNTDRYPLPEGAVAELKPLK